MALPGKKMLNGLRVLSVLRP